MSMRVVYVPAVQAIGQHLTPEEEERLRANLIVQDTEGPPSASADWNYWTTKSRVRRARLAAEGDGAVTPLPEVRDGCMTCFVRGAFDCPAHKSAPLGLTEAEPATAELTAVERYDMLSRGQPKAEMSDPLPGWDRTGAGGFYKAQYIRSDGCCVVFRDDRWKFVHQCLGELADYSSYYPDQLMRWADARVPLVPQKETFEEHCSRRRRELAPRDQRLIEFLASFQRGSAS